MIRIRFKRVGEPVDCYRRSVFTSPAAAPVIDEVTIPGYLYPGTSSPFDRDLYERSPAELSAIGQEIARLALGSAGLSALADRRKSGETVVVRFEESPEAPGAAAVPWELMHDGEEFVAANPKIAVVRSSVEAAEVAVVETRRPLKVLIFWSAPVDQTSVDVETEQVRVALALAPSIVRREIEEVEILHCTRARARGPRGAAYPHA